MNLYYSPNMCLKVYVVHLKKAVWFSELSNEQKTSTEKSLESKYYARA